jgi:hypothetical protein
MQLWPHSRVLLECLFLLSPPFLCVAWSCAVVDKKEHTTGAIQTWLNLSWEYINGKLFAVYCGTLSEKYKEHFSHISSLVAG